MKKLSLLLLVFVAQSITTNGTKTEKQTYRNLALRCYEKYKQIGIKTKKDSFKLIFFDTAELFNCLANVNTNLSWNDRTTLNQEAFIEYKTNVQKDSQEAIQEKLLKNQGKL